MLHPRTRMEPKNSEATDPEVLQKARRARCIIYWVMGVFAILPLLLAWLTGNLRF